MFGPLRFLLDILRLLLFVHGTKSYLLPLLHSVFFSAVVHPLSLFGIIDYLITWLLVACLKIINSNYQYLRTANQYVRPRLSRIRHYHLMRKSRRRRPICHARRKILKRPEPTYFADESEVDREEHSGSTPVTSSSCRKFLRKVDVLKHFRQLA